MIIDTRSFDLLRKSLKIFFNDKNFDAFIVSLKKHYFNAQTKCVNNDKVLKKIRTYINNNRYNNNKHIKQVYLFHITRLIKKVKHLLNLTQLLTTNNDFLKFLLDNGFNLDELKKNPTIDYRLKEDPCVNGFCFRMHLEFQKDGYYENIKSGGSELLRCFGEDLIKKFVQSSKFYCVHCKVNILDIIFDGKRSKTSNEVEFLSYCMLALVVYPESQIYNPIIRLKDDYNCEVLHCEELA